VNKEEINNYILEVQEKWDNLTQKGQQEFLDALVNADMTLAKDPRAYELVQDALDWENKLRKEKNMENKNKTGKELSTILKSGAIVKQEMTNQEWKEIVISLYHSGYFADVKSVAQAIAKAQCGKELGFAPFYSLQHVYIIPGKPPAVDGQAMAALIKRAGYNYRAIKHNNDICTIKFFDQKGQELGESTFTYEEARRIRQGGKALTDKSVWQNYRQDLLFWRTLSRGARRYCPDAISGVYYYEEVDYDTQQIETSKTDLSEFKTDTKSEQKQVPVVDAEIVQETKGRKEQLQELVEQHGKDKIKQAKDKLEIQESLLNITDEAFKAFAESLEVKKEKEKEEKPEKKKKSKKAGMTIDEKKSKLIELVEKYGKADVKEVKDKMEIEGKIVELNDKEFNKFVKNVEKEADI